MASVLKDIKAQAGSQDKMQFAPFRPIDDFITAARFEAPTFNNEDRWFNRIVSNLIFYQTNYFISAAVIFFLVAFAKPQETATGLGSVMILLALALYANSKSPELSTFKRNNPALFYLAVLAVSYWFIYQLGCIAVFLLGVILPIAFILAHASFRLRNMKNKLAGATEALGLAKSTPMAFILREFGIEPDLKYL